MIRIKVKKYINKLKNDYTRAIPEAEKARQEKFKNSDRSLIGEIRNVLASSDMKQALKRAKSAIEKQGCLKLYLKLCNNFYYPDKYAVFFLHYQHERTTLPEGKKYTQQWLAIRAFSEAIPDDWKLIVKEHPSMFRNIFSRTVRDKYFYRSINSLTNTLIAPLNISPFNLVDKAVVSATVTGTAGLESVIRGTPAFVFGVPQYRQMKGIFEIDDILDIKKALDTIKDNKNLISDEKTKKYLTWVDENSFESDDSLDGIPVEALQHAMAC